MKIKLKLLDRYILQQVIGLFIGSVGLLTSLGVALGTISDLTYKISESNLPLIVAIQIFCLSIPKYAVYALPMALLLTTLLVYGQLNKNLELIAFYSSGISIHSLVIPAIFFSLLIIVTTFLFNEFAVPYANFQIIQLESPFMPEAKLSLPNQDIFYPEYQVDASDNSQLVRLYYAQEFDSEYFQKIIILNWQKSQLQNIIIARQATWERNQQVWLLIDGRIEYFNPDKVEIFTQKILFLPPTFFKIANQITDPQEMSLSQAQKYLKLMINSNNEPKIRLFQVRIQQKLAFPFICLVFTLIGSGIGINFDWLNRGKAFSICVGIVFSYYLLGFLVGSLGIVGLVSPFIAGWLPNFLGWGIGSWLLYCNNR
ncbi:MAG TPA: LptF/LptG family permease [Xenococcaceae cyanobacterium]|jgi:lipopolysaccharide export system permease protein